MCALEFMQREFPNLYLKSDFEGTLVLRHTRQVQSGESWNIGRIREGEVFAYVSKTACMYIGAYGGWSSIVLLTENWVV